MLSKPKSMTASLFLCVLCGTLLAADGPADSKKESKDAGALQGTWQVTRQDIGDQPTAQDPTTHRLVFSGKEFRLMEGDNEVAKGTFKLDPAASPHTIDMDITESSEPDAAGKVALGIYELKGDDLKWCSAQPGSDQRPTKFDTKGTQNMLATLHRKAAQKK